MKIECNVNGKPTTLDVDPMRRLLDVIREDLGLTGTKEGCGEGECGACSVLLNGKLVNSCLIPVAQAEGCEITTIEAMRESELGRIVSDAFAEAHAVQCGFCSPGMMMAAMGYLAGGTDAGAAADAAGAGGSGPETGGPERARPGAAADATGPGGSGPESGGPGGTGTTGADRQPTEAEIREAISGNICRCTGYDMIVDGIQLAGHRLAELRDSEKKGETSGGEKGDRR